MSEQGKRREFNFGLMYGVGKEKLQEMIQHRDKIKSIKMVNDYWEGNEFGRRRTITLEEAKRNEVVGRLSSSGKNFVAKERQ